MAYIAANLAASNTMTLQPVIHRVPTENVYLQALRKGDKKCRRAGSRLGRVDWPLIADQVALWFTAYPFLDHVAPVFSWPEGLHTENGSHFVNNDMQTVLRDHGVSHFTGPISHPGSTGLFERTVLKLLDQISKSCIDRGTTNSYSLSVRDIMLEMSQPLIRE